MEKEKLIIRPRKTWECGDSAVRIPVDVLDKVKDIATETNNDMKSLIAEMLEYALANIEVIK